MTKKETERLHALILSFEEFIWKDIEKTLPPELTEEEFTKLYEAGFAKYKKQCDASV